MKHKKIELKRSCVLKVMKFLIFSNFFEFILIDLNLKDFQNEFFMHANMAAEVVSMLGCGHVAMFVLGHVAHTCACH